ncbi:iron-sulfur cluster assembly accessory protein [Pelagibacteraceae bacterium]|nr:iron-sulfur cluster assembly accessory protein [Pelagibacteraceae bacterium]
MNTTKKLEFTTQALDQINKIVSENTAKKYFRISVLGGGCSGFKYNFTFDDKIEKEDLLFNKTIIDKDSLSIIEGSIVDFKKELIGDTFVIKNPKASSSCGCGLSFSV